MSVLAGISTAKWALYAAIQIAIILGTWYAKHKLQVAALWKAATQLELQDAFADILRVSRGK